jgi:hypothetical protein
LRVDLLGPRRPCQGCGARFRQGPHHPAVEIEQPHPQRPEPKLRQVRREPIRRNRDGPAVGRPGGLKVGKRIGGQLPHVAGDERVDEEIRQSSLQPGQHDARAIRRPARRERFADSRQRDFLTSAALVEVDDDQHGIAGTERREREARAAAIPGTR